MGSEEVIAGEESRSHFKQLLAIGVVASAIGVVLGLLIDWFPTPASTQAETIDTLWDVLLIASVPVFVLVISGRPLLRLEVPHAAGRGAAGRPADPRQHAARGHLDVDPGDLILARSAPTPTSSLTDIEEAQASEMSDQRRRPAVHLDLRVPGRLAASTSRSTQLYLPRTSRSASPSAPRTSSTTSGCPAFRMKIDAVPGVTPTSGSRRRPAGDYPVVCAELCGLGHAVHAPDRARRRPGRVRQLDPGARRGGAAGRRRRAAAAAAAGRRRRGRRRQDDLHRHRLRRLPRAGRRGHERRRRAPTSTRRSRARTRRSSSESIVDPSAEIAEGFPDGLMPPNYGDQLTPEELDALVEYLAEVTE